MYRYRPYMKPGQAEKQKTAFKLAVQVALWGGVPGVSVMLAALAVTSLH
ncbi:hypothetical protein [Asticcacaulis solisilvae]